MWSLSSEEEGLKSQKLQRKYLTIYTVHLANNIHLGDLNFIDVMHG